MATKKILLEGDSKAQIMVWPNQVANNQLNSVLPSVISQNNDVENKHYTFTDKSIVERKSYSDHSSSSR